jgi:CpeT protein
MRSFFISLAASALISGAATAHPVAHENPTITRQFANMLLGTFDSSTQAIEDSTYLDVTVLHCDVQVTDLPANLDHGEFLALRQSVSTSATPYRVRVLRVFAGADQNTVRVSSYAPRAGVDLSELCSRPAEERKVSFSDLSEERCTTSATKTGDLFLGGTTGDGCQSTRAGAVRMTSVLTLSSRTMTTWDRGWSADGQLVWGPENGPYQFEKTESQDTRLAQLAAFFSGRLSNAEQVKQDPLNFTPVDYRFCQIDVRGAQVRPATRLMFANQQITTPNRVIERRRIYEFFRDESGSISVRTNTFNEGDIPANICDLSLEERRSLPPSILDNRDSCVLTFNWLENDEAFVGGTPATGCPSQFQGSVKMTIEEVIKDGLIQPWERWFNAQGEQVAGSKTGPYIYKRQ